MRRYGQRLSTRTTLRLVFGIGAVTYGWLTFTLLRGGDWGFGVLFAVCTGAAAYLFWSER